MEVIKCREQILISLFITNIQKIHDNHIEEDMFIDEQPEEPEQPTEEATSNIIDEQLVTKAKRKGKKIVKEPEQPKETVFKIVLLIMLRIYL